MALSIIERLKPYSIDVIVTDSLSRLTTVYAPRVDMSYFPNEIYIATTTGGGPPSNARVTEDFLVRATEDGQTRVTQ